IIGEAGFLEVRWRLGIEVKPVNPNACLDCARELLNLFTFIPPLDAVAPSFDPVNTDFTACGKKLLQVVCNIGQRITRGALRSCSTLRINSGVALCRNDEER